MLVLTRTNTSGLPYPVQVPVHEGELPSGQRQKRFDEAVIAPMSAASFRAAWFIAAESVLVTVFCAPYCAPALAASATVIAAK
jgi:hypothetical protein